MGKLAASAICNVAVTLPLVILSLLVLRTERLRRPLASANVDNAAASDAQARQGSAVAVANAGGLGSLSCAS